MKYLLAVLALTTALSANAQNWSVVTDGDNGERLLLDTDSLKFDEYVISENNKSVLLSGIFKYFAKEEGAPFYAVIDVPECIVKHAGSLVHKYNDNTTDVRYWSETGKRFYDSEGAWLCGYAIVQFDYKDKKKNTEMKPTL
jgi:hypothetical protein